MSRKGIGGRPRKPTAQKKAEGTYRKDRDTGAGTSFPILLKIRQPPLLTTTFEKNIWKTISPPLFAAGVLSETDVPFLVAFCQQLGLYFEMQKVLKKEGRFVGEGYDRKLHPAWKIAKEALEQAHRLGSKFGLTPSDREKLIIRTGDEGKEDDPFDEI